MVRTGARQRNPGTAHAELVGFACAHARIRAFPGSLQRTDCDGYRLPERTVPDYNLIYVWEGAASWTIDGRDHDLRAGELVIVPPGVRHHGRSAARTMALGSVHALAELPGGRDLFQLFAPPTQRSVAAGCRLDRLFRVAMEEYARPWAEAVTAIPHWTALIVSELLRHDASAGLLRTTQADPVVALTLRFLDAHLADDLRQGDIARAAGYTCQHLNRLFRRALGATPLDCLAGLRLERAEALLREGRSVAAVARAVGYRDPAYFGRVFRARHGLSPSAYRDHAGSENPG